MDDDYDDYNNKIIIDTLRDLYTTSNGINWIYQDGYIGSNLPFNKWYGINLDENKLIKINLSTNNLEGILIFFYNNIVNNKIYFRFYNFRNW